LERAKYATPAGTGGERQEMAEEVKSTAENTPGEIAGKETANSDVSINVFS
jgi:hypothetical protein